MCVCVARSVWRLGLSLRARELSLCQKSTGASNKSAFKLPFGNAPIRACVNLAFLAAVCVCLCKYQYVFCAKHFGHSSFCRLLLVTFFLSSLSLSPPNVPEECVQLGTESGNIFLDRKPQREKTVQHTLVIFWRPSLWCTMNMKRSSGAGAHTSTTRSRQQSHLHCSLHKRPLQADGIPQFRQFWPKK